MCGICSFQDTSTPYLKTVISGLQLDSLLFIVQLQWKYRITFATRNSVLYLCYPLFFSAALSIGFLYLKKKTI